MYLPRILLSLHSIGKTAQNMKERLPDLYLMMSQGFPIWGYPAMGGVPVVPVSQWPPLSPTEQDDADWLSSGGAHDYGLLKTATNKTVRFVKYHLPMRLNLLSVFIIIIVLYNYVLFLHFYCEH